jgi:2-polyprenyl-3-methyl-5-hydroxy-6-metoxy-1,4-benzoquinol methylase
MDISEFKRLRQTSQYARHPWEIARGKVMRRLLAAKIPVHPDQLADIGSGDAYVVNLALRGNIAKNYYAIDIEYTPEIVAQLEENNAHSTIAYFQTIQDFQREVPAAGSRLYLCMDVLEHLKDEKEILDLIARKQANPQTTYFFFTVPAFQSVFSSHDVLLGHYRRYTAGQFRSVLETNGLTVIDSGYFFFTLLVARWFERKLFPKKDYSIDNWEGSSFKTRLLTGILRADFAFSNFLKKLGIRLPGLSCYCVCRL